MKKDQLAPKVTDLYRFCGGESPCLEGVVGVDVNGDRHDETKPVSGVSGMNKDFIGREADKRIVMVGINLTTEAWLNNSLGNLGFTLLRIPDTYGGTNLRGGNTINGILWDLEASSLRGFALVSQLRRCVPGVRVMVLTNPSNKKRMVEANEQGVMDYLTKPIDLTELRNKCVRLFG